MNELHNLKILIYDIETATLGNRPNAEKDKLKFFGCYSYVTKQYYYLTDVDEIKKIINEHDYLVGFNTLRYDNQVLFHNGFHDIIQCQEQFNMYRINYKYNIDLFQIIKNRSAIIKIDKGVLIDLLMSYSLDFITKTLGLVDDDDGKIKDFDYNILKNDKFTTTEIQYIESYIKRDLDITRKLYEWVEDYFSSFKLFLPEADIKRKSYINSSVAAFAYKFICNTLSIPEVYADVKEHKRYGGGYVSYPAGEHFSGKIICLDYNSLYPSIMHQCNIYSPVNDGNPHNLETWNGNSFFDVEGVYYAHKQGKIENMLKMLYEQRLEYKANKDPKEYAIKIVLNCFDKDTQCLTVNDGIKYIKDCKIGDLVYSINPKTLQLEVKPIVEVKRRMYHGVMHRYVGNHFDFKITPEHKLLIDYPDGPKFIKSKDLKRVNNRIPKQKVVDADLEYVINTSDSTNVEKEFMLDTINSSKIKKKYNRYYSIINKKNLDTFVKMIVALGGTFVIKEYVEEYSRKYKEDSVKVHYTFDPTGLYLRNKTEYIYNDYIYNVMVKDNHTLLAGSNGKFNWIGQTTYGLLGNESFKQLASNQAAGDVTRLARQWIKLSRTIFRNEGYPIIYTDTDSLFIIDPYDDDQKMLAVKDKVIDTIKSNIPFPYEMFDMGIDERITDIWFFKSRSKHPSKDVDSEMDEDDIINRELNLLKKNYIYLTENGRVVVKGLGVRKKSTSALSRKIFWEELVPLIKENRTVKFEKSFLKEIIYRFIEQDISLMTNRYDVRDVSEYKNTSQLHCQISAKHGEGIHFLIPNKRVGVGKGKKYCTMAEFNKEKLTINDIDFSSVWRELKPFIKTKESNTIQTRLF